MAKAKTNKWKEGLKNRLKESTSRSTGNSGFFKPSLENVTFWKCDKGDHIVDIVPYTAGANDPNTPEGEPAYFLEVYAHFSVGAEEGSVICMAKTYKKPCPICDHRKELVMEGADEETIKALNPKQRCIYNIVSYDSNADEEKGVQVWHVAHWFSEHHFQTLARKPVRGGKTNGDPFVYYMDPEEGKSIAFNKEGVAKATKFIGHRFIDRDYELPEEFMKNAVVLDDILHIPTYDEVFEMYWGNAPEGAEGSEDDDEPVETPKKVTRVRGSVDKKVKKVKKEVPAEEPEEEEEEETPEALDPANCDCDDFLTGFDSFEECETCEYAELCKVGVVKEKKEEKPKPKPKVKAKKEEPKEEEPKEEEPKEEEPKEEEDETPEKQPEPELDLEDCDCDDFGKAPDEFEECEGCDYWGPCAEKKAEADSKKETKPRRKKP